jgi:hypothetical protein
MTGARRNINYDRDINFALRCIVRIKMLEDISEEIAAHFDTSSWDSLANKAKGESSPVENIVPELHSSDQDSSPEVIVGQGLDESLGTNSPATQSASDIGQRSRLKETLQMSHSFPQESKTNKPAGILRRMTSSGFLLQGVVLI